MGHALGVHLLLEDRRVGRSAPHREVVAADDDRAAVDAAAAHDEVGRREVDEVTVVVVGGAAGQRADLVEAAVVEQARDALTNRQLPERAVLGDLLLAAHPRGELLARASSSSSGVQSFGLCRSCELWHLTLA